jgi:hypothetical protein
MITFNPDKFGYYEVDNRTTYSKMEAAEWAHLNKSKIRWNFNDEIFSKIDWSQEPKESLWELYKSRARQIRAAYDYVVLWYSGGSDSHNMLLAWIDAGLKIDEIATTWNYETTGDPQNHYNAEITNVVLPDIKKLQESGIDFKFRIIDMAEPSLKLFDVWGTNFEYNINCHFSPNNPARAMLRETVSDYKNMIAQGKKLCFVWGKEKPFIDHDPVSNKFYTHFLDNGDNCVSPYVQSRYYEGWYDEFFYWTPDFPLIPVKQAHVLINFAKYADAVNTVGVHRTHDEAEQYNTGIRLLKTVSVKSNVVKLLLYPKWSNDIFSNGKTSSFTYSMRDDWFFLGNLEQKKRFIEITNTYYNRIDPTDKKRITVSPMFSRKYYL